MLRVVGELEGEGGRSFFFLPLFAGGNSLESRQPWPSPTRPRVLSYSRYCKATASCWDTEEVEH